MRSSRPTACSNRRDARAWGTCWRTSAKCGARRRCARTRRRSSRLDLAALALDLEREAHPDRAEATVHVDDLTRDAGREVGTEEGGRVADVLERHIAPHWGDLRHAGQHLPEARNAGGRECLDGARRDAVDAG